jgi:antirestriction protein ArdC
MQRDLYQDVTDRIIAALERGTVPWLRPWRDDKSGSATEPYNAATGRPYNGVNLLILGLMPYPDLGWLTFRQAKELGGNVRRGERGTTVIFWRFVETRGDDGERRTIPIARAYTVFNVAQCETIDPSKLKRPMPPVSGETDINALCERNGAIVKHGGDKAFYSPGGDYIAMPSATAFRNADNYAATLAHELVHWSAHSKRCNRDLNGRFGSASYVAEELIAEMGSAFLCARIGIPLDGLQHPSYIESWLRVLKDDKRAIFTAASKAKEAAEFLTKQAAESEETELELAA